MIETHSNGFNISRQLLLGKTRTVKIASAQYLGPKPTLSIELLANIGDSSSQRYKIYRNVGNSIPTAGFLRRRKAQHSDTNHAADILFLYRILGSLQAKR
jgi:hypothetical protein